MVYMCCIEPTKQGTETDWGLEKTLKAAYCIFKQSPARWADFLSDNDIADCHDEQTMKLFFPLKFCGHRWLENGKALTRFLEISEKITNYLTLLKERKTRPLKDKRFPLLLKNTKYKIFPAYCEFSLSICRDIEPFLNLFQLEKSLAVFLYTKIKFVRTKFITK